MFVEYDACYLYDCVFNSDHSTSEAATHKSDLANLAQSDPEFYQFLLSEDQELLDFSEDDVSDDMNQSDEAEDLDHSDDEEAITSVMSTIFFCHQRTVVV